MAYIWPKLGNPPLVTPFSQYVKNIALMNVMFMVKGQPRWSVIDKNSWDMILGKAGKLPGKLSQEIIDLAAKNGFEFFEGNPQDNYPDELPRFMKEMEDKGWEQGQNDEELFEFAMHEKQYRDYKSGAAKQRFDKELETAIKAKFSNGNVEVPDLRALKYPNAEPIVSPFTGRVIWEIAFGEVSMEPEHGKLIRESDTVCNIETSYGVETIGSFCDGNIIAIEKKQGQIVRKGEALAYIERKIR